MVIDDWERKGRKGCNDGLYMKHKVRLSALALIHFRYDSHINIDNVCKRYIEKQTPKKK